MENYKKLVFFEIFMAIIAICIIGALIFMILFQKDSVEEEESCSTIFIATPISEEEPETANLDEVIHITQAASAADITIEYAIKLIEKETEEIIIEEEIIVNPYIKLIENLTDYEKELIYKITFLESGNQKAEGQRAVIEVIFNRVLSDNFPDDVEGVLSQPHQFSTWVKRNKVRQVDQDRIVNILDLVYNEEPVLPCVDYLYFDGVKHTKYATNYIQIQDHWFGTPYKKD